MDLAIAAALLDRLRAAQLGGAGAVGDGRRAGARRLGRGRSRARWRSPRRPARAGAEAIVVPAENGPEAALATGIEVIPIDSLGAARRAGRRGVDRRSGPRRCALRARAPADGAPDLADLRGQRHLRYALEVAAAGGHSLLMVGPPGAGQVAGGEPPALDPAAAGRRSRRSRWRGSPAPAAGSTARGSGGQAVPRPAPHDQPGGLVGGGNPPRPGEATLAHRGVLFLDELCEFRRDTPRGAAGAARDRAGSRSPAPAAPGSLPCRFMLVAAANPCPCGRGEADPECTCAPLAIQRYQGRLSGALADRIDILAAVRQPSAAEIGGGPGERSAAVRERVVAARERQERRLGPGRCNAEMTPAEARECALAEDAAALLAESYARQRLSGRAHDRVLRLARTVADLAGGEAIGTDQMAQALQLRRRDQ